MTHDEQGNPVRDRTPGAAITGAMYPSVPRVRTIAREAFQAQYARPGRPLVIEGLGASLRHRWTPATLRERFGTQVVNVETDEFFPRNRPGNEGAGARADITVAELIDAIESGSSRYRLRSLDVLTEIPGLLDALDGRPIHELFDPTREANDALWIAPEGNTSSFHHDFNYDNVNVQVYGRKRFILASPGSFVHLYRADYTRSEVDPYAPDLARHPHFTRADVYEATLAPGEALFIPRYWWHCVQALEPSINFNTWRKVSPQEAWSALTGVPLHHRTVMASPFIFDNRIVSRVYHTVRTVLQGEQPR